MHETPNDNQQTSRSKLPGLLAINAVLLVILALVTFGSAVRAQPAPRGRGEYTMVAGGGSGTDASIIWIVDVANQEMIAMTYNHNTDVLDGVGYRSLAADAAAVIRGRAQTRQLIHSPATPPGWSSP